jgi:glycosyltransferase involved in cell wall biosynthesis
VHVNTVLGLPEALVARAGGKPTMLHVHEMLSGGARASLAVRMARVADHLAAASDACAKPLRDSGLSASVVRAGLEARQSVRRDPANRPLVVGTLGTISKRKGSDLFVEAACAVARRHPGIEFRMIGPLAQGRERVWAAEVASRARAAGIVCEQVTDPLQELSSWDIFVLPTRRDPFPNAVLEAMSVGLPVVVSRVDGVSEQLDSASGILIRPDDLEALTRSILRLIEDRSLRFALGAAARERLATRFTPDGSAEDLERAYLTTLSSRRSR